MDPCSWQYAYVPIAADEGEREHIAPCPTYGVFEESVGALAVSLPDHLSGTTKVHLDPDFESLTYGEPFLSSNGRRASRGTIIGELGEGDFIAFFAGFRPMAEGGPRCAGWQHPLAYCLFGIFVVERVARVGELSFEQRCACAHGRREGAEDDLVVFAKPRLSGRFRRAIPIGEYRDNAYRVQRELLEVWGGLAVRDGYIQRSARPPRFKDPGAFRKWLEGRAESSELLRCN